MELTVIRRSFYLVRIVGVGDVCQEPLAGLDVEDVTLFCPRK